MKIVQTNIFRGGSNFVSRKHTNRYWAAISWYFRSFSALESKKKEFFTGKMFRSNRQFSFPAMWVVIIHVGLSEFLFWIDPEYKHKSTLFRVSYIAVLVVLTSIQLIKTLRNSYTTYKMIVTIVVLFKVVVRWFEIKKMSDEVEDSGRYI